LPIRGADWIAIVGREQASEQRNGAKFGVGLAGDRDDAVELEDSVDLDISGSSDLALSRSLGYRRRSRRRRPRRRQCWYVLLASTYRQPSNRRRAHGSLARPGGKVG
jgi:hypothetical protein